MGGGADRAALHGGWKERESALTVAVSHEKPQPRWECLSHRFRVPESRRWRPTTAALVASSWLAAGLLCACTSQPPARLDAYLGPDNTRIEDSRTAQSSALPGSLNAGLVVINDTTAPESAPPLSDSALLTLTDETRQRIGRTLPIDVTGTVPSTDLRPGEDRQALVHLAARSNLRYLMVAVVSNVEASAPAMFTAVAGSTPAPGQTVDVFTLVELALLDGETGKILVRGNGRDQARLNQLNDQTESNEFPAIVRSIGTRETSTSRSNIRDTLYLTAASDALDRALLRFSEAWEARRTRGG